MAYPGGTYIQQIADWFVRQEFDSFYSLLTGWLSVQHKQDGSHGAVTADSLTVAGNVTSTGTGSFNGNVTADADGTSPVIIGLNRGAGIAFSPWEIVKAGAEFGGTPGVIVYDDANSVSSAGVFGWERLTSVGVAPAQYALVPAPLSVGMQVLLGRDASGYRFFEANATTGNIGTANVGVMNFTGTDALTLAAGNNNDQTLTSGVSLLTITCNGAGSTLTGMTGGVAGRVVIFLNIGSAGALTITQEDALSAAANRFVPAASIASGECVMAVYTNRWRLITGI